MPVTAHLVPLDTAKSWAKRLAKSSKELSPHDPWPLARCQLAVAQMLGFDHWHALSQRLSLPAVTAPSSAVPVEEPSLPSSRAEWRAFWAELLDIEGEGADVHVEFRREMATIRRRVHGEVVNYRSLPSERALAGLATVVPGLVLPSSPSDAPPMSGDYGNGVLELQNSKGVPPCFQCLPVYPGGQDVIIRAKPVHPVTAGLAEIISDPHLLAKVRQVTDFAQGAFFFTGHEGSGKNSLMQAAVQDLVARRPRGSDVTPVEWGEVRDKKQGAALFRAVAPGAPVFAACHSSGHLLDRLSDFDLPPGFEKDVRGWAHTRLLPVLCRGCSIPAGPEGQRARGKGCPQCSFGITGRQVVLDLWSMKDGKPFQEASMLSEASRLVQLGRVARQPAEELLGPLAK